MPGVVPLKVSGVENTDPTPDVKVVGLDGDKTCEFGKFAQQTAPTTDLLSIGMPIPTHKLRVDWEIGSTTPSFTFEVGLWPRR